MLGIAGMALCRLTQCDGCDRQTVSVRHEATNTKARQHLMFGQRNRRRSYLCCDLNTGASMAADDAPGGQRASVEHDHAMALGAALANLFPDDVAAELSEVFCGILIPLDRLLIRGQAPTRQPPGRMASLHSLGQQKLIPNDADYKAPCCSRLGTGPAAAHP